MSGTITDDFTGYWQGIIKAIGGLPNSFGHDSGDVSGLAAALGGPVSGGIENSGTTDTSGMSLPPASPSVATDSPLATAITSANSTPTAPVSPVDQTASPAVQPAVGFTPGQADFDRAIADVFAGKLVGNDAASLDVFFQKPAGTFAATGKK